MREHIDIEPLRQRRLTPAHVMETIIGAGRLNADPDNALCRVCAERREQ